MSADVVIVGAGVIGAATAFHLSLLGAGDVLVLDRATVGSGMSCRSSALVRMHYTFGPEVELAVRSDAMFEAWPDLTGRPGCVRRTGFVRIVASSPWCAGVYIEVWYMAWRVALSTKNRQAMPGGCVRGF